MKRGWIKRTAIAIMAGMLAVGGNFLYTEHTVYADTFDNAQLISIGKEVEDIFTKETKQREYEINLSESGILKMDFASWLDGSGYIQLYDGKFNRLKEHWFSHSDVVTKKNLNWKLEKGKYTVVIKSDASGKYLFDTAFESANMNHREDNSSFDSAADVPINKMIYSILTEQTSIRYFKLKLSETDTIQMDFASWMDGGGYIHLYDSKYNRLEDKWIGSSDTVLKKQYSWTLDRGTYYLVVKNGKGKFNFNFTSVSVKDDNQGGSSNQDSNQNSGNTYRYTDQWVYDGAGWWYSYAFGGYPSGGWSQIGSDWYYFNENGYMASNQWIGNYYVGASGAMVTNSWVDGFYVGEDGGWVPGFGETDKWVLDANGWWYSYASGGYPSGGWSQIGGVWYYFDGNGYMASNQWIGNYYVGASGAMVTNSWIGDYYVGEDGGWISGYGAGQWVADSAGWWYSYPTGGYPANEWKQIGGAWYYFNMNGYMAAGQWIDNYYVDTSGVMMTNSRTPDGYYVGSDGAWIM